MSAKGRGTSREHRLAHQRRAEGWVVYRGAGSHGCADLVCLQRVVLWVGERRVALARVQLIQVKANHGSPYKNFSPAERRELSEQAAKAGARAILAHWPPGQSDPTYYPEDQWPSKETAHAADRNSDSSSAC